MGETNKRSSKEKIRAFEKKYGERAKRKLRKFFLADALLKANQYSEIGFTDCEIAKCVSAICGINIGHGQIKRWRDKDFLK